LAIGLATLICALLPLPALAAGDFDRWFVVLLNGERCGWSHEWQETDGDRITTFSAMSMTMRRGADEVSIEMETEFVETTRGEPVSCRTSQMMGAAPVTREFTWTDEGVRIVTTQSGRTSEAALPEPGEAWLTPAASAEYVRARLDAGADTIQFVGLEPTEGLVLSTTMMENFEPARADLLGESVEATACEAVSDLAPSIRSRAWLDGDGRAVRTEIPMGGMTMSFVMTDQATAMQRGEAPELMVQTLVAPDRPIREPRRVREASYVLRIAGGGAMPDMPATSNQTVEILGHGTARVIVDMNRPAPAEVADPGRYLESSMMLEIDDPEIVELAEESVRRAGRDPLRRAEALRRGVYRHIRDKTLGVGFATASEVCRTREGDCSEHGVLLAAVLRAEGIPSRVVSGLVYVDEFLGEEGVFGFHMWTQALIEVEGEMRWVDLDATLSPGTPFDATHIALVTSSMSDGESTTDMTGIVSMLGTLGIEVERVGR
jgi:hypothetical protein